MRFLQGRDTGELVEDAKVIFIATLLWRPKFGGETSARDVCLPLAVIHPSSRLPPKVIADFSFIISFDKG
jgi:hypothetical protein